MATSLWERVDEHLASFIHFGKILNAEQRRSLARKLVTHLYDPYYEVKDEWEKLNLADTEPIWALLIKEIFEKEELRPLTAHNEDLSISVAQNVLNWLHKTARSLEIGHAHTDELIQFRRWQDQAQHQEKEAWSKLVADLGKQYPAHNQNWDFYGTRLEQNMTDEPETGSLSQSLSILQQNVIKDWEHLLFQKKHQFERDYLRDAFGSYYDRLKQKADKLHLLGDTLEPYYRHLGELWNKSLTEWNKVPWDKIESYVKELKSDKSLKELADILGRWQMVELEIEEQQREKILPEHSWKPNPYGKSEIIGIHYSDHISATLPMEFAMLSHPDTEAIFSLRFAEKKLLSLQYRAQDMASDTTSEEETIKEPKIAEQGPIILVIDTSGSMYGQPETIAKAISFVILSRALKHKRPCFLISFSDGFKTLELTKMGKELDLMIDFLTLSFHGGTDIQPALREALRVLKKEAFEKADVLVVSDFMIPWIEEKVRNEIIVQRKQHGTQFHSLYISRSIDPGAVPLTIFDHHWIYDLENPQVIRQTLEAFDEMENG
jgi:uncharacterized protein with von Willebrand factor type A (vWA) domain